MQRADIKILDEKQCKDPWGYIYNHETKVCAHSTTSAVCVGDSGGPIYVTENGKKVQVGISSFVSSGGCLSAKYPVVFARVSTYIDWISDKLAKN